MALFKKKITEEHFVDILLHLRYLVEEEVIKCFNKYFEYDSDKKKLLYEARIFSLWLTTLSTSPKNEKIKDMLHHKFCEYLNLDESNKQFFFEEVDKRYKNYYAAYNIWRINPQSGGMIGSVMIEIIKNQNPDFSLEWELPLVDGDESLKAFVLFSSLFNNLLQAIGDLKKDYKLDRII